MATASETQEEGFLADVLLRHSAGVQHCVLLCRESIQTLDADITSSADGGDGVSAGANKATLGMILNGFKIDQMLAGGPAWTAGLEHGAEIVQVDGESTNVDNLHELLRGRDIPGSMVSLSVRLPETGEVRTAVLTRMPTRGIAVKRALFEHMADLKEHSRSLADQKMMGMADTCIEAVNALMVSEDAALSRLAENVGSSSHTTCPESLTFPVPLPGNVYPPPHPFASRF